MSLLQSFLTYIRKENLFSGEVRLILAVSGGIDSVVLSELCKQAGFQFVIAHCNFRLRGEESNRDEEFVRRLGERLQVEVLVEQFETDLYAQENKISIQVAARELRYAWFAKVLEEKQKDVRQSPVFILTAHHADDNIETMLMNFFKGTGIAGLRAILPKQGRIIRPLLFARKSEIRQFASEHGLQHVEDSSNASDKYTRNYFRNQLIPAAQKVFPQAEENLANNIDRFRQAEMLYLQAIDLHKKKLLEQKGNEIHIPVLKLKKAAPLETITYEIIKDYGFTAHQTSEVLALMEAETGKFIQSESFRIIKSRNWLIISSSMPEQSQTIVINPQDRKLNFEKGRLSLKEIPAGEAVMSTSPQTAQLDAASVLFPLLLRKRRAGDYFYPLGLNKKKKVSRFISDQKLPVTERENTWVVEMDKKILWIVGQRIDDRFKITGNTKKILQIHFSSTGQKPY